jgi:hypothetical protein
MDEQHLDAVAAATVNDAPGGGGSRAAQAGHERRYARRARGNPNGSAGRRAGSRVARPTAGKRKRLVCERSDATVGTAGPCDRER